MAINNTDLTTVNLQGNGSMDAIMQIVKLHLDREHEQNRITGNDYATVYTSLIGQAIQAGVQYSLNKPAADKQLELMDKDLLLKDKDLELADKNIERTDAEIKLMGKDLLLKDKTLEKTDKELQLMDKELVLTDEKIISMRKDNEVKDQQIISMIKDNEIKDQQILISKEDLKLRQQELLIKIEELNIAREQLKRVTEEIELLKFRAQTEKANTDPTAIKANSLLDKQRNIYEEQTKGYVADRDIKQRRLYTDLISVLVNANPGFATKLTESDHFKDGKDALNNDYVLEAILKTLEAKASTNLP